MISPCSASAAKMRAVVPSSTSSSGAIARRRANSSPAFWRNSSNPRDADEDLFPRESQLDAAGLRGEGLQPLRQQFTAQIVLVRGDGIGDARRRGIPYRDAVRDVQVQGFPLVLHQAVEVPRDAFL